MPAGTSAEPSAGVRDGMEAFAFGTTKTPPNRAGEEESGVRTLLTSPANFCSERNSGRLRPLAGGSNLSHFGCSPAASLGRAHVEY